MPAITASMVAELRAKTDAPMMECKKALTEAEGDSVRAEEILRVKLGNKAGKASSRVTAEGVVAASVQGQTAAMVEVNCETDFVTKNDSFLAFVNACAKLIAEHNPADIAALGALAYIQDGFGPTLEDVRKGLIGKIGENMSIRRFKRYAAGGQLASYLHGTRIGALVEYTGDEVTAKDVAMHVAAMKPKSLSTADVPAELIAKSNPADVAALSALPHTQDGFGPTLEDVRKGLIGKIGENMSIRRFKRYEGGKLASYLHGTRIGVMVEFDGDEVAAKDVAMHVAAMKPVSLAASDVPAALIERERNVAALKAAEDAEKAKAEGKTPQSAEIVTRRVEGSVQKYLKEVSLLSQTFVKNDKQTVEQMLKERATQVVGFTLYVVGEGIEKKVDDFAAEVAAQVAAAKGG